MSDKRLAQDITALVRQTGQRQTAELPAPKPRDAILSTTGKGVPKPKEAGAAGGIASPLVEPDAGLREYWEDAVLTSTDGVFTWHEAPVKTVLMVDNNGEPVELRFDNPYA